MHCCKEALNRGNPSCDYTRPLHSVLARISPGTPRQTGVAVPVAWRAREPGLDSTKFQGQLSAVTRASQQFEAGGGKHYTPLGKLG